MLSELHNFTSLKTTAAILGILDSANNESIFKDNKVFIIHILLVFKLYVYKSREKKFINTNNLIAEIRKVKRIENAIVLTYSKKIVFTKKWHIMSNNIP